MLFWNASLFMVHSLRERSSNYWSEISCLEPPCFNSMVSKPLMFGLITYDRQNKEHAVVFFFDITNLISRLIYKLNLNGFNEKKIYIYIYICMYIPYI